MTPAAFWTHTAFEAAAYTIGFQWFLHRRRARPDPHPIDRVQLLLLVAGAAFGAALGAKIAYWLYDPAFAFADFPNPQRLLAGKSIIGGLIGGLFGVEVAKRIAGIRHSTGDAFVAPLILAMIIGRIGCFLAGIDDHTWGNPTDVPWAIDLGDGVPRHPTPLYEIAFLAAFGTWLARRTPSFERPGDRFKAFLCGYLLYRLLIEGIRPMPHVYFGVASGLQLLCLFGLLYHARDIPRIARALAWSRK